MISNSRRAAWSRTCTIFALGAFVASTAVAGGTRSTGRARVGLQPTPSVQSQPAAAYSLRVLDASGTPVTQAISVVELDGSLVAMVQPGTDGTFQVSGSAGQQLGFKFASPGDSTLGTTNAKVELPATPGGVIDVYVPTAGSNPATQGMGSGSMGTIGGSLGGPLAPMQGGANCDGAVVIAVGGSDTGNTGSGTTGLAGAAACGTSYDGGPLVWYALTGNGNTLTVDLCNSSFDTKVFVFRLCGTPCSASTLTCLAGNDDACGLRSRVSFASVSGTNYRIAIGGYAGQQGAYAITITDGAAASGIACPLPTGACCITNEPPFRQNVSPRICTITNEPACLAAGGVYSGDDVPCVTGDIAYAEYEDGGPPPGLGLSIPSGSFLLRTITVTNPGIVADVNIEHDVQHWYNGTLNIYFEHNSNTNRLWNNVCGWSNLHYTSDRQGTEIYCNVLASGLLDDDGDGWNSDQPRNNPTEAGMYGGAGMDLNEYVGVDATGAWNYTIQDMWGFGGGFLQHWGLELTSLSNLVDICPVYECAGGACRGESGRVEICHDGHTIEVANQAASGHLEHGDTCGACEIVP